MVNTEQKNVESEFLSTDELSKYLNVSIKTIRKYIETRQLPGMVKIGRLYRFRKSDVEKRLLSGNFLLERK